MALFIMNKKTGRYEKASNLSAPVNTPTPKPQPKIVFQQPKPQTYSQQHPILDLLKNVGKAIYEGGRNTAASAFDVGLRTSPLEGIRNMTGGAANIKKPGGFKQGFLQSQARPLLWEKVTGKDALKNPREFIADAASAPTYFYAGARGLAGNPLGNIGSRVLARSAEQLPVAGVNTALQQFKQGNLKDVIPNFATNELALAGLSNVFGEAGRYIKSGKIAKTAQGLDEHAKAFVEKQPKSQPLQEGVKMEGFVPGSEFKKRGFVKTVQSSELADKRLKMLVDDNYIPQPNDDLILHAGNMIKQNINSAKAKALKGDDNLAVATATELIKHYQNLKDFDAAAEITKSVAQKLTEHGRAIQAASLYNKLTPEGIKIFAQKELSKEGLTLTKEQADELAQRAVEATKAQGEDKIIKTQQMLNRVQEFVPSKFVDQLATIWKAGLLTNPTTHLANLGGNITMSGLEMAKDIPATVYDKVASLFTGQRTKTIPNILEYLRGAGKGARKAWVFMKTGVDVDQTLGKYDFKQTNLPPILKQYAQIIFRALGAGDKVFKEGLLQKSLKELATVEGLNKGLSGKELAAFSKKLYQNPTIDMVKMATEDALYGTFNNPNKLSDAIAKLKGHDSSVVRGFTEFIAPFSRTPSNIAGRIIDYSPVGFLKAIGQGVGGKGQRKVVESLGRATVGSGVIGAGYGLGKAGLMTGNYPTNPTEQNIWDLTGKQPGALKVGGTWNSLNRLSPMGNMLSIGSGMADLGRAKPEDIPFQMAGVAGKNLLGQTYLQGVSGMLNAIQDPKRYGETWGSRLASSVVPSIIGATTRVLDPTMRQTNSMAEAIRSRIPGESQNLLPKQTVFGDARQYGDAGLGRLNPFFNPFNPSKATDTPLTNEINRLYQEYSGVSLGDPSKQVNVPGLGIKIDMTPEEFNRMERQSGGVSKKLLETLVQSPQYKQLSDYDKSNAINNTISKIRQIWNVQNLGNLQNAQQQFQEQVQKQIKLRQPFYTP